MPTAELSESETSCMWQSLVPVQGFLTQCPLVTRQCTFLGSTGVGVWSL